MPSSCGIVAAQVAVAAPCSGVLKRPERLPCSSTQPSSRRKPSGRWRCSAVRIGPGCDGERAYADVLPERVELDGEEDVGGLRLPVRLPPVVAAFEHADRRSGCPSACARATRARRRVRLRPPRGAARAGSSSVKWPRWLVASCASQPGPDPGLGQRHDPGVVDQQVDRAARGEEALGEGVDALLVAEVELVDLDAARCPRAPALPSRAGGPAPRRAAPAPVSALTVSSPMPE